MRSQGLARVTTGSQKQKRVATLDWRVLASSRQLLGLVIIVVIVILLSRTC